MDQQIALARELARAVRAGEVRTVLSESVMDRIATLGLLPLRESLAELFEAHGIVHISPVDASRILLELLSRADMFQDVIIEYDLDECSCNVNVVLTDPCSCHANIDDEMRNAWILSAALSLTSERQDPDVLLTVRAKAGVASIQGNYSFSEVLFSDGQTIEGVRGDYSLPMASSLEGALLRIDPLALARRGLGDPAAMETAVRASAQQYLGVHVAKGSFSLNSQWILDLAAPEIANSDGLLRRTLRAAAEVVTNTGEAKSHALRQGAGATTPQICSGEWSAWRHDVDRDYHVHYWRGPEGRVQLCTAKSHNQFAIPALE